MKGGAIKEGLDSKISKREHSLPISSEENKLDKYYRTLRGDARVFGMDIGEVIDIYYKSLNEYIKQYDGRSKEIDRKRYAVGMVEEKVENFANLKEVDRFIESEKRFRRNQLTLF